MAVVQIRPVRVDMRHRVVVMPMRMLDRRVNPMMVMGMMPVIMAVAVVMA
jgi:hypothetical protein